MYISERERERERERSASCLQMNEIYTEEDIQMS